MKNIAIYTIRFVLAFIVSAVALQAISAAIIVTIADVTEYASFVSFAAPLYAFLSTGIAAIYAFSIRTNNNLILWITHV